MTTATQTEARPICSGRPDKPPHEPRLMHHHGSTWSGYNKRQRYKCGSCGRTTIVVEDKKGPTP